MSYENEAQALIDYENSLLKHIASVDIAGTILGVPKQQLLHHDDSKWTDYEFPYYARQFKGDRGDPEGFARAWLSHCHENPHHWQHWVFSDDFNIRGGNIVNRALEMPAIYLLEMVADWLGSSFCYTGSWDMTEWLEKNYEGLTLHPNTRIYVDKILREIDNGRTIGQI